MTIAQLQMQYPGAIIEAGIGGVHYQEGNDALTVKYDYTSQNAQQTAIDALADKIARLKA